MYMYITRVYMYDQEEEFVKSREVSSIKGFVPDTDEDDEDEDEDVSVRPPSPSPAACPASTHT